MVPLITALFSPRSLIIGRIQLARPRGEGRGAHGWPGPFKTAHKGSCNADMDDIYVFWVNGVKVYLG